MIGSSLESVRKGVEYSYNKRVGAKCDTIFATFGDVKGVEDARDTLNELYNSPNFQYGKIFSLMISEQGKLHVTTNSNEECVLEPVSSSKGRFRGILLNGRSEKEVGLNERGKVAFRLSIRPKKEEFENAESIYLSYFFESAVYDWFYYELGYEVSDYSFKVSHNTLFKELKETMDKLIKEISVDVPFLRRDLKSFKKLCIHAFKDAGRWPYFENNLTVEARQDIVNSFEKKVREFLEEFKEQKLAALNKEPKCEKKDSEGCIPHFLEKELSRNRDVSFVIEIDFNVLDFKEGAAFFGIVWGENHGRILKYVRDVSVGKKDEVEKATEVISKVSNPIQIPKKTEQESQTAQLTETDRVVLSAGNLSEMEFMRAFLNNSGSRNQIGGY